MNHLLKTATVAFLLLLALTAAATVSLWYFIPREQVRDLITRELSSRLNQDITMSGFSLGLYPDLEFTARNMRVVDPPSSQEIASAEKIRFDLDTRQLLNRRFVIETMTIGSPRVTVSRTAAGTWNIADAVRTARAGTAAPDKAQPSTGLKVREIKIKNGSISVSDELQGRHINLENLSGTINLQRATATVDSASLKTDSLTAELSGSLSQLFTPDTRADISAKVQLRKEGPLADIGSDKLPAGAKIADLTVNASGSIRALAVKSSFSIEPPATAGLSTRGSLTGTLQAEQGLCTVDTLDLRSGKNTLSLSGSLDNLWQNERSARLQGTTHLSLDETIPLMQSSALSNLGLKGMADARISLTASSGQTNLSGTIDLSKAAFSLPNLMSKDAGSPASLLFDAELAAPDALIINNFELMLGENRIMGSAQMSPGSDPRLQASLHTSPLALTLFNQLRPVDCEGGVMTLSAQAWQTARDQDALQYRAQALMRDGRLTLKIMREPFDTVNASIEAVTNLVVIPQASFFLGDAPFHGKAEITIAGYPQVAGQVYTNTLDIDAIIRAFRKSEKPPGETPPEVAPATPSFSLDIAVDAASLCFGKLTTGAVSTLWHTSGRFQQFEPLYADLFGGTLDGALHLSCQRDGTTWFAAFTGRDMDIESLCSQFFTGKTIATAKGLLHAGGALRGTASSRKEEAWQSLEGDVRISASQGEIRQSALFNGILLALRFTQGIVPIPGIRDLNLLTMLRDVAKTLTRTLDVSRMVFRKIDGSFTIRDGIARTEDLYFVGDDADFAFTGTFDLVRNEMDITINVIPTGTIDSLVQKIPLVGKRIGKIKKATLSFNLIARGSFANPDVQLRAVDKILP
jgi:uncharacterized protein involved in outer membrane biogenesis